MSVLTIEVDLLCVYSIAFENLTSPKCFIPFFSPNKRFLLHSGLVRLGLPVLYVYIVYVGLSRWHSDKEATSQCRRCKTHSFSPWIGQIPWRRNPLQYSCLENSMDRGAWQATVHGATKSQTCYIYISLCSVSLSVHTHTHAHACTHTHTYNLGDFESTYFSLFPVLICTLFQNQNNEMLFNGPILNPLCTFSFPVIMIAQYFSVMKKLRLRKMSEYTQGHCARKS